MFHNDLLTPAEWIATIQVSRFGTQTINLDTTGNASSGTFRVDPENVIAGFPFSNLVLPAGVTQVVNLPSITFLGSAVIQGVLTSSSALHIDLGPATFNSSAPTLIAGDNATPANFVFLSGGDITAPAAGTLSLNVGLYSGGNASLKAGRTFTVGANGTYTDTGAAASGGSVLLSSLNILTNGGSVTLEANGPGKQIQIGNVQTNAGTSGGAIMLNSPGDITTGVIESNGSGLLSSNGGRIDVTSASGNITVNGDINSSGGGAFYSTGSFGNTAGGITISSPGIIAVTGPILAAGSSGRALSLTANQIQVNGSIGSYFGAAASPYAQISVGSYGTGADVKISTPVGIGVAANTIYSSDANYGNAKATVSAQITGSKPLFLVNTGSSTNSNGASGFIHGDGSVNINGCCQSATVTGGGFGGGAISIIVNGAPFSMSNGQLVTPSQWVAAIQTTTGSQTLILDASGNAVGGTFNIDPANLPAGGFSDLNLPANVSAFANVPSLSYSGATLVSGRLSAAAPLALTLGSVTLNTTGSALLAGGNMATSNFVLLSTGNILSGSTGKISLTGVGYQGGSVDVRPGVLFALGANATYTIGASVGGSILMPGVDVVTKGGAINLTANGGTHQIQIANLQTGSGSMIAGAVNVMAPGSIRIGSIDTFGNGGATGTGGAVNIVSTGSAISINGGVNSSGGGTFFAGGPLGSTAAGITLKMPERFEKRLVETSPKSTRMSPDLLATMNCLQPLRIFPDSIGQTV